MQANESGEAVAVGENIQSALARDWTISSQTKI